VNAVVKLADKLKIDMPISRAVYNVCYKNKSLQDEAQSLLQRESKDEFEGI
jgi:glycerol-3-phosphate dehydrogenase